MPLGDAIVLAVTFLRSVWGRVAPDRICCCRGCVGVGEVTG
jgi:hypothetical protein